MKTAVFVILLVTLSAAIAAETDTQVNTVVSWDDKLSGCLVNRDIQFAKLREQELMLGSRISPHFSVFGTYTHDSHENDRMGTMLSWQNKTLGWNLATNLFIWHGLNDAGDRTKLAVYCIRPLSKGLSLGLYYLNNKTEGNAHYSEYGPVISLQKGSWSANFYCMDKNTGNSGLQLDIGLNL